MRPPLLPSELEVKSRGMKIGIVTDDGVSVSPHFGMSKHYLVVEIENGVVKGKEMRTKASHQPERGMPHHAGNEGSLHHDMLSNVRDCQALVARGMGRPMYESILRAGIKPYITGRANIDEVVQAFIDGTLDNLVERLH